MKDWAGVFIGALAGTLAGIGALGCGSSGSSAQPEDDGGAAVEAGPWGVDSGGTPNGGDAAVDGGAKDGAKDALSGDVVLPPLDGGKVQVLHVPASELYETVVAFDDAGNLLFCRALCGTHDDRRPINPGGRRA
jgi:hypothetical protein